MRAVILPIITKQIGGLNIVQSAIHPTDPLFLLLEVGLQGRAFLHLLNIGLLLTAKYVI